MNKLMLTIESCMSSFESLEHGNLSAIFSFPPDFPGFNGHFPDNPVLPAVCILQAVMVMATRHAGPRVELKKISSAKWFAPTAPNSPLNFLVQISPGEAGAATLKTKISRGNIKVADLILTVEGLAPEGKKNP